MDELEISQEELSRLSPGDQQQLQVFVQSEVQKATIQKSTLLNLLL
jgi:hypothetical protein